MIERIIEASARNKFLVLLMAAFIVFAGYYAVSRTPLARMANLVVQSSHRVSDAELKRLLCACALASPSKSDLQQRDIVDVTHPELRERIGSLMPHMPWVKEAPVFLVFCANGRRVPAIAALLAPTIANRIHPI